jgi:hypothetical protein
MHLPCDVHLSLPPTPSNGGEISRVDGTLACYHTGGNAIAELGPSFSASSVHSLPPKAHHWGELRKVDGTLIRLFKDGTAIAKLSQSFIAGSVLPLSTHHFGRGRKPGRALGCHRPSVLETAHLAFVDKTSNYDAKDITLDS